MYYCMPFVCMHVHYLNAYGYVIQYQEEYTCLCDLVEMITLLLGSQGLSVKHYSNIITLHTMYCLYVTGSEKLTAELESAAPEHLLAAQVGSLYLC